MKQRVHLITLGTDNLERAADFYDSLGWKRAENCPPGLVAYDLYGATLGLYGRESLMKDIGIELPPGSGSMTLSCNSRTKEDVDAVMASAEEAGAKILKPPQDMFWGGYGGYFADPDAHIWEVTFNPFAQPGENDEFQWNGV
ncbi:VOC family protein [Amaricoccus tamworthensis]|uniref:VOC family protein n=1 Tax=Amaricoccus tamworthensis TaxID=57002 RepID=UPI003C7CC647